MFKRKKERKNELVQCMCINGRKRTSRHKAENFERKTVLGKKYKVNESKLLAFLTLTNVLSSIEL